MNGPFRYEFLDAYLFESLSRVREMAGLWRLYHDDEGAQKSPGHLPPSVHQQKLENPKLELSH